MIAGKMRSRTLIISFISAFFILSSLGSPTTFAASNDKKVFDNAGLFTESEVNKLEDISEEYGEEGQVDIVIITEDSLNGKSRSRYLEDFYDEMGFGYDQDFGDTAMILINMEPGNRGVEIQGYGNAENHLTGTKIEHILDDIVPLLSDGDYYDAMDEFAQQVAYYMNQKSLLFNTWVQLGIALLIGAVIVGIMIFQSGGKVTVHSRTYLDEQTSRVVARRDDYIRTTTTRVRKPSNNNNGGGGGVSRGGHSHSGGGRGF